VVFIGISLGPTVGGLIIKGTGSILSVFYFAAAIHILYALIIWTILPESLSRVQMRVARRKYAQASAALKDSAAGLVGARAHVLLTLNRVFSFAAPLAMFLPVALDTAGTPSKATKKDWSLTFVAASQFMISMILVGFF
jgi:hypothetical protein